jgi:hypothetical protein
MTTYIILYVVIVQAMALVLVRVTRVALVVVRAG